MTYLSMREAAEYLPGHVQPRTIRARCKRGLIKAVYNGRWYTTQEALNEYLRQSTQDRSVNARLPPIRHTTAEEVLAKHDPRRRK